MTEGLKTMIFPVTDIASAKSIFSTLLGVQPSVEGPYYIGFDAGGQHIGLRPNGRQQGMSGPLAYWHVADIREHLQRLLEAGAKMVEDVRDVGGGRLVASVEDTDGNNFGLIQG